MKPEDILYVAPRALTEVAPFDAIKKECLQCHSDVWVHISTHSIATRSKGIICIFCASELKNKTPEEIIEEFKKDTISMMITDVIEKAKKGQL